MTAYTPKYFRRLSSYYLSVAKTAREYNVSALVCNRLEGASIQLCYAAQALEDAQKKRKRK